MWLRVEMNVRAIVCMYITWSVEFLDLFDAALCLTLSVSPLFLSPPLSLSLSLLHQEWVRVICILLITCTMILCSTQLWHCHLVLSLHGFCCNCHNKVLIYQGSLIIIILCLIPLLILMCIDILWYNGVV